MNAVTQENKIIENMKTWFVSIILILPALYFSLNAGKFNFIDYVNLLIHERGHGVFSFFGKFIYTLGGTLAQILIPGMFIVYYGIVRKVGLMQVFLIWLGENFINISVYAADARAHKLPLLGGNKVYHDWTYILNQTGLILYDWEVGRFFYWLGVLVFIIAILIPAFIKPINKVNINLDL
jgi:hypothetical protein